MPVYKVFLSLLLLIAGSGARQFSNPVIDRQNNPDPGVLLSEGVYYAVTTSGTAYEKFPIHSSTDLQNWRSEGYVLTESTIPQWTEANHEFWAPELHIVDNSFLVYFTSRDTGSNQLAIGVARADNVLGPYQPTDSPLVLNRTMGSIDATLLTDNGDNYLVWKDDGNGKNPKEPTIIWARKLAQDGLSFASDEKRELIRETLPWEGDLVEGPWFVQRGEYFYLFYSGSGFCGDQYAVGVARSTGALGPYEKHGDPILVSNDQWKGPGHCSVVQDVNDAGSYVMVYHAWRSGQVCGGNSRLMLASSVEWSEDDWPFVREI